MLAWLHLALVYVDLAGLPSEAGVVTVAGEHVHTVSALTAIEAGSRLAVVDVDPAVLALVARRAVAGEVVDPINAGGSV